MQGRIKRRQAQQAQAAAATAGHAPTPADANVCALCERSIPVGQRDAHHLVPKSHGGVATVWLHRLCHRQVHAHLTERELARHHASLEALQSHPAIAKFIDWVRNKPTNINPPTRRSRDKRR